MSFVVNEITHVIASSQCSLSPDNQHDTKMVAVIVTLIAA